MSEHRPHPLRRPSNKGDMPVDVAFSPNGKKAYVTYESKASGDRSAVLVIDTRIGEQVGAVSGYTGKSPTGIAFSPDGLKAYCCNRNSDSVCVFDTAIDKQTGTVSNMPQDIDPLDVVFSVDGKEAYVLAEGDADALIIDASKDTCTGHFPAGEPHGIALSPDGKKAYVTSGDGFSGRVLIIDLATGQQTGTVKNFTLTFPSAVAFSPDGKKAYVAGFVDWDTSCVAVIDTKTDTQTSIVSGYANGQNQNPLSIAFSPSRLAAKAYVANYDANTVSVIDTTTDTQTGTVQHYVDGRPYCVAFSPDGNTAYVTNTDSNDVSIIDTENDTQVGRILLSES